MHLFVEELKRLQNLASVEIDEADQEKFLGSLDSIIGFLQKMQKVEVDNVDMNYVWDYLQPIKWVKKYVDSQLLLDNVEHEIINNSIVVKSALNNI